MESSEPGCTRIREDVPGFDGSLGDSLKWIARLEFLPDAYKIDASDRFGPDAAVGI